MAAEKALALVVRGTDWSETSRITTLFTREFGKVRALAKGGRRLKSNFDVAFDLLTVCHIVFLRKAHGGLDLLTEAQMAERFPALRHDLHALYAGYYVAELLADGTQDYDPHPPLFDAAVATLRGFTIPASRPSPPSPPEGASPEPAGRSLAHPFPGNAGGVSLPPTLDSVTAFELVWLKELGYSPRLDVCTGCGARVLPPGAVRVLFSPSAGGVLCSVCGPGVSDRRALSAAGLTALRGLTAPGEQPPPDLSPVRGELRALLGQLVSFVLGRRPRLLGYVEGR
ncbi:MAG: recO [Gemmataceae bacterium]|nr:recO [Gemmataceae bacterium]